MMRFTTGLEVVIDDEGIATVQYIGSVQDDQHDLMNPAQRAKIARIGERLAIKMRHLIDENSNL